MPLASAERRMKNGKKWSLKNPMTIELKPCPFCGNQKPMLLDNTPSSCCYVECRECSVRTNEYTTKARASIVWNRRWEFIDKKESKKTDE